VTLVVTVWPPTVATAYAVKRRLCLARRLPAALSLTFTVCFLPAATETCVAPRRLGLRDEADGCSGVATLGPPKP